MEIKLMILGLAEKQQVMFSALTCEKMLYPITRYDEYESNKGTPLFEECITALYSYAIGVMQSTNYYAALKEKMSAFCPDLDETKNVYASYALDSCLSVIEALSFILTKDPIHIVNCATSATDTVDMFVQMASDVEPSDIPDLEEYIRTNPFMIREINRQATLLEYLSKNVAVNAESLARLREINGEGGIIDLDALKIA